MDKVQEPSDSEYLLISLNNCSFYSSVEGSGCFMCGIDYQQT
jgi:hypothetical protein